jgi:WXG100 family type VII secretion target
MSGIRVKASPEEITRVADLITAEAGKFNDFTIALGQASDITNAWGGAGSAEFAGKIQECLTELKKMASVLEETGATLKTQAKNYEAAQEANRLNAQRLM